MKDPLPALAVALAFVDRINHTDLEGLCDLMTEDHRLEIFGEAPVVGRQANMAAWRDYLGAFPEYVIHPHHLQAIGSQVAILGHTTGSHLRIPDDEEAALTLVWVAEVRDGKVVVWRLLDSSVEYLNSIGSGEGLE